MKEQEQLEWKLKVLEKNFYENELGSIERRLHFVQEKLSISKRIREILDGELKMAESKQESSQ